MGQLDRKRSHAQDEQDLFDATLGKDVVDRQGRHCGIACGVHHDRRGRWYVEVEWRIVLGFSRTTAVPLSCVMEYKDSELVLAQSLVEFKRQSWSMNHDDIDSILGEVPGKSYKPYIVM